MSKGLKRNYSVALIVPTDAIGLLIGKQGLNLKDIAQGSGAKLSFQAFSDIPAGSCDRGVVVAGSLDAVVKAQEIILQKLKTRRPKGDKEDIQLGTGKYLIKWIIPSRVCGLLIGRSGEGIKHINDVSGAWVKVGHEEEASPGASERMVYITGTQEQNAIAKQMVIEKVGGRPFIASTDKEGDMVTVVAELRVPATCCEVQRLMRDLQAEIRDIEVNCGVAIIASPLSRVEIGLPQRDIVVRGGSDKSRLLAAEHIRSLLTHLRSEQLPESEESCIKFLIPVSAIETFIGSSHDDVLRTLSLASDVVVSIDMESKSPSISQNARELIVAGSTTVMLQAVRAIIERQQSIGGICRLPVQTTSSPGPPNALIDDFSSIHPAMNMWSVPMYSSLPAVSGQMIHGLWPLPASAEGFYYSPEASIAFQQQLYQNYVNSTFYSNVGSFVSSRSSPPVLHSRVLRAPADPPIAPSISDVRHGRSPPMHLPYYVHAPLQQNRADPTIRCDMIDAKSSKKAQRGIGVDSSKGRSRKQSIGATYPLTINEPLSLHPASSASQEHAPNSVSPNNSYNAILSSPLELVGAPGGVIVSPRVFPSGAMPPSEPSP